MTDEYHLATPQIRKAIVATGLDKMLANDYFGW